MATGGLSEDDIAYSVRGAIPGVDFRRGDVVRIDIARKSIRLEDGAVLPFDDLVLATGSTGTTFDVVLKAALTPGVIALAIGLAVLGGVIAGAFGGFRASRLRPADALRSVA